MEYAYALDFPRLCDSYLSLFISIGGNIAIENSIPKISEIRNLLKHLRTRNTIHGRALSVHPLSWISSRRFCLNV